MTRIDYPANHATHHLDGLFRFFAGFRFFGLGARSDRRQDAESMIEPVAPPPNPCEPGGYNEAFVMQHWANYDPMR